MTIGTLDITDRQFNVEEWLELEKQSEVRHEFYYGKLIPMAGEAKKANRISKTLVKLMDDHLLEHGYEAFYLDVKVEVLPNGIYRYPDMVVAPVSDAGHEYIVKYPVMLVEVASEDSSYRDRVKKRKEYFKIPGLWYYLIISQDEIWVELHLKSDDDNWTTRYFTEPEDVIELERFGLKLSISALYKQAKV
ncbi:MAG: Uma2 family endonuclease [Bacteroidetes bacterium]|nr:Uma2 family endonuclease [Bacteroidota bacterium]